MSTNRPAPPAQRPAGPPMRGPMGAMMGPPQKAKNFKGSARRLLGLLVPHRGLVIAVLACCTVAVAFTVSGPKILGRATDIIFKGFLGSRPAGTNPTNLARAMHVQAGQGIDFGALADVLALVMALYAGAVAVHVAAGLHPQPPRAARRQPAARRRRRQADARAARVLRSPAPWRGPVARHQRHRERRDGPAADDEPDRDGDDDGARRAGDARRDLAAARGDRARHGAAVDRDHREDRQARPEGLRRAVEARRRAERSDRGGVHRPRARQGVRPAPPGRGAVPREERRAVRRQLQGAVHLQPDHAGDHLRREPQLRRDRRGRRPARRIGRDAARQRAGVHSVLAPVHAEPVAARAGRERLAVGRGVGRARVRAPRRARSVARSQRRGAAGGRRGEVRAKSGSTTSASATRPTCR